MGNPDTITSMAARSLAGKLRWVLSAKPVYKIRQSMVLDNFFFVFCANSTKSKNRLISVLRRFMFQRLHQDTLFGRPIVSLPAFVIRKQHVMFSQAEEFIFEKVNSFVDGLEGGSTAWARMLASHILTGRHAVKRTLDELDDIVDDIQFFESSLTDENSRLIMRLLMEAYNASDQRTEIIEKQENNPHIRQLLSGDLDEAVELFRSRMDEHHSKGETDKQANHLTHIFCLECLYGTLQRCEDREDFKINCPVCRIKFSSASYCPDMTVLNRTTDEFFTTDSMVQPRNRRVSSGNRAQGSDLSPNKRRKAKGGVMFLCQSFDRSQADRKATDGWIEHVGREMPSAKLSASHKLMKRWIEDDPTCKVVVFTGFISTMRLLEFICDKEEWECTRLSGKDTPRARTANIARFQNDTSVRVMIATEETGGVGICLTAGNKCIVIDPWWNEERDLQAVYRVYRIGQTREVECVFLWGECSIDHKIRELQESKTNEIKSVFGPAVLRQRFSRDELKDIWLTQLDLEDIEAIQALQQE
ncbi:hypothetical protein VI817_006435 [Penicillium citrinum]|nr:hypothetical protein VI817_006435 [Penicillium citrinum]